MPDAPSRFLPSDSASGAECCQHVHVLTARATPPPENCSFLPQPSSRAAALSCCPIIHGQNRETRILTKFCHAKNGSNNHQHKGKSSVTGGGIRASRLRQELLAFLKRLHHEGKGRERESGRRWLRLGSMSSTPRSTNYPSHSPSPFDVARRVVCP